jgi:ADP-heptose:LPS heptosyltransferase
MRNPKKILVVQLRRVGDVVFTLPVLRVLRENFPGAEIDFLVEKPSDQLVALNPYVSRVLVYEPGRALHWIREVRRQAYDWVLDFHSNGRTLVLTYFSKAPLRVAFKGPVTRNWVYDLLVESTDQKYLVEQKLDFLRALSLKIHEWSWDLKVPEKERRWAGSWMTSQVPPAASKFKWVGIAPASRRATRAWIPERFAQVARNLNRQSRHVLFLWGPGEEGYVEQIARRIAALAPRETLGEHEGLSLLAPRATLLELAGLISNCHAVLAVDNGPKNIAVALGVPTVTIDGPTNPLSFNPSGDPRHVVVRDEELFCIGCGLNRCPYGHECMKNLTADRVFIEVQSLLDRTGGGSLSEERLRVV